jgi:para-aminobenzoate synthetase component 1
MRQELGSLSGVSCERFDPPEPFLDYTTRFATRPNAVMLFSGGSGDCARYHILGLFPRLIISGCGNSLELCFPETDGRPSIALNCDPFALLQGLLDLFQLPDRVMDLPITTGLLGYLAYDLKDQLERLPRTTIDRHGLPELYFIMPQALLIHDRQTQATTLCVPQFEHGGAGIDEIRTRLADTQPPQSSKFKLSGITPMTNRATYLENIARIRERIRQGTVYQVNYAQQFEGDFTGSAFALMRKLFLQNPASFYAFINAGDHQIVSTSPERFLLQRGDHVETRPIKGTRPRAADEQADVALRDELIHSRKDDAELAMIVDLMRNDLGKVCRLGSVRVKEHKRVESYRNVHHLVSIVEGELDEGRSSIDLLKASFPGGSITGCPKISAMKQIDELEGARRHIYTGSIGYLSFHETMDFSIAIRTATISDGHIRFSTGGGIVYDSDPIAEFEETLHKGRSFFEQEENLSKSDNKYVWLNGQIVAEKDAQLPVMSAGFQYGYGLFETLSAQRGRATYLTEHLDRLRTGWQQLFTSPFPELSWNVLIKQLWRANRLEEQSAAVKILVSSAARPGAMDSGDIDILVTLRPYHHRLARKKEQGLHLGSYPHSRQTPLADLKSLNHLYYIRAGEWAAENNYDEALIFNPDGSVSECNSANLLLLKGQEVILPQSPHVLPGVMQAALVHQLMEQGFTRVDRLLIPDDLLQADQVLISNSLIGVVPALSLDGQPLAADSDFCLRLRKILLG